MADLKALAEQIVGLTLLEAQELKTILKDEYGIEPASGGAVMMAGPAGGGIRPVAHTALGESGGLIIIIIIIINNKNNKIYNII